MPQFKIKDLMVNLNPGQAVELQPHFCWRFHSCWYYQSCWHFHSCWNLQSCWHVISRYETILDCPNISRFVTPVSPRCPDPTPTIVVDPTVIDVQDLAALKGQLQAQLAQIEAQEQAANEAMRPKTLDEVNQLEEQLQGALAELREMKKTMGSK